MPSLPLAWFSALFFEATLSLKDANKLRTVDREAKDAPAMAAPSPSSEQPPPPPPPPSLVQDDNDDAVVGPGGRLVACVAAMLAIALVV